MDAENRMGCRVQVRASSVTSVNKSNQCTSRQAEIRFDGRLIGFNLNSVPESILPRGASPQHEGVNICRIQKQNVPKRIHKVYVCVYADKSCMLRSAFSDNHFPYTLLRDRKSDALSRQLGDIARKISRNGVFFRKQRKQDQFFRNIFWNREMRSSPAIDLVSESVTRHTCIHHRHKR